MAQRENAATTCDAQVRSQIRFVVRVCNMSREYVCVRAREDIIFMLALAGWVPLILFTLSECAGARARVFVCLAGTKTSRACGILCRMHRQPRAATIARAQMSSSCAAAESFTCRKDDDELRHARTRPTPTSEEQPLEHAPLISGWRKRGFSWCSFRAHKTRFLNLCQRHNIMMRATRNARTLTNSTLCVRKTKATHEHTRVQDDHN